ncbi:hypothetical protein BC374_03075 [Ensifer sp. LC13]|nr:hypothetical protein BC362_21335 [Ensifer sp. LC14]OCP09551.1 hypothetical protein BC374_03075 [Ensifer sp. LC13]OCP10722.1 hypothetical protein BBX50_03415 [Ensifer sp. LC11]OCP32799.1 hypothetical protein BC364_03075 [Ensifer sp. LC499]
MFVASQTVDATHQENSEGWSQTTDRNDHSDLSSAGDEFSQKAVFVIAQPPGLRPNRRQWPSHQRRRRRVAALVAPRG